MDRELVGRRILVTRPAEEAEELVELLVAKGAQVLVRPTVAYFPPTDEGPLVEALGRLSGYSWLVLTSARAARALQGLPAGALGSIQVAAVGHITARAVEQLGLSITLQAPGSSARSLAAELAAALRPGDRVMYLRAERVSVDLAGILRGRGAAVDEAIAYRTGPPTEGVPDVEAALQRGEIDWITAFSGSALRHLAGALSTPELIGRARLATLGPATSREAERMGLTVHAQAHRPDASALVEAIAAVELSDPGKVM